MSLLPGEDFLVPQVSKPSFGLRCQGILHGVAPDQAQNVSILVVSAMLAVRWLEATAGTSEHEMAAPTPEQLSIK